MAERRTVGVLGTGTIGASWTVLFLVHGLHVRAWDPAPDAADQLSDFVERAWPALEQLGSAPIARPGASTASAPGDSDLFDLVILALAAATDFLRGLLAAAGLHSAMQDFVLIAGVGLLALAALRLSIVGTLAALAIAGLFLLMVHALAPGVHTSHSLCPAIGFKPCLLHRRTFAQLRCGGHALRRLSSEVVGEGVGERDCPDHRDDGCGDPLGGHGITRDRFCTSTENTDVAAKLEHRS